MNLTENRPKRLNIFRAIADYSQLGDDPAITVKISDGTDTLDYNGYASAARRMQAAWAICWIITRAATID